MRGAVWIAWRQSRQSLLWLSVVMFGLCWLLAAPIAPLREGVLKLVSETPFLQRLVGGIMGLDLSGQLTLQLLVSTTWAHPFLLIACWGFATLGASRFPARELEQGTLDTLMCQPLSRTRALLAHTLVTLLGLLGLTAVALLGFTVGLRPLGNDAPTLTQMLPVAASLWASSVFMLGLATLVSAHSRHAGRVTGTLLGVTLWSLLLAYLKPFVPWTAPLAPSGLLHYYRPGEIMQSGTWPLASIAGLLAAGLALWLLAARKLNTRDL